MLVKLIMLVNIASTGSKALSPMIYGTAWKKEATADLVYAALHHGFRAIDTACQPKHYNEAGVGDALVRYYGDTSTTREDVFLQTKFTSVHGQDPTSIPYHEDAPLEEQVSH
jgi:diketogulonate reductase-like aldo/keto reductase